MEIPYTDVLARVQQIEALIAPPVSQPVPQSAAPVAAPSFATMLAGALQPGPVAQGSGSAVVAAAATQLGASEQPPGSNDGPQIAAYRSAVAGAEPGEPWCAYFASWAAAQAGTPLGDSGQGLGSVAEITSWAQQTGRYLPAGSTPAPGDLILFGDEHVGIVESVNADGSLTTIEGNYDNAVSEVHRLPSEATGYVSLGA
ncbi:MAG TPA: CHAP domain-containing protein [Gaiellaceae bacterium]|nr:CHAP domain-containing protein [Gaiellaceae bacterium]